MRILVIDDNQDFREFLGGLIGFYSVNADVVFAENGVEGLKVFSNNPTSFNVVFTDRRMPGGMWGEDVVRKIKKISPKTRVIFMSADDSEEVLRVAIAAGADKILFKPFRNEEIKQVLSE